MQTSEWFKEVISKGLPQLSMNMTKNQVNKTIKNEIFAS